MARHRTSGAGLAGLLNSTGQPIYVVDDEQTIVFANRACLDWVGLAADELIGRRSAYHSAAELTGGDAVAAALCPPPAAIAGRPMTATVDHVTPDGHLHRRRARFIPLGRTADDTIGVVTMVDPRDLDEGKLQAAADSAGDSTTEPGPLKLHERIRRYRRRAARWHDADRLLGSSHAMRRVRARVELAIGSRASVEVVGPPGSGRKQVAGTIHYTRLANSAEPGRGGSLVPLACSTLGTDLVGSTIRALARCNPLGETAAWSTLLLNEADRLPAEVQPELATLLGEASFPMRLIATSRRPLGELAAAGRFDGDLALLLSTLVIELQPLARRRGDLPLLAQMFLEQCNAAGSKQLGGFTQEALDRLDAYPWPGNLDELATMVAEAHRNAEGPLIGPADLPKRIRLAADAAACPQPVEQIIVLDDLLADVERELLRRAMGRAKGNKAKAARLLGMTRARLYRRLVQLGVARPDGSDEP